MHALHPRGLVAAQKVCVWNMCDVLPADEQLSIHKIIQTLSSPFKNAHAHK